MEKIKKIKGAIFFNNLSFLKKMINYQTSANLSIIKFAHKT